MSIFDGNGLITYRDLFEDISVYMYGNVWTWFTTTTNLQCQFEDDGDPRWAIGSIIESELEMKLLPMQFTGADKSSIGDCLMATGIFKREPFITGFGNESYLSVSLDDRVDLIFNGNREWKLMSDRIISTAAKEENKAFGKIWNRK